MAEADPQITKGDIRKLEAKARECRMWANEQLAKAADAAADDDVASYQGFLNEATRLTLLSAKFTKRARASIVTLQVQA